MNNARNYINSARNNANQRFNSFAGNSGGNYLNAVSMNLNKSAGPRLHADGPAVGAGVPQSQPYIINITNVSATAVNNFDILGAFTYLQNAGFDAAGSLTISGVTISSAIPGVSYRDLLWQSTVQPFSIGMTYIQSATANQITQTMNLTTRDANGNNVGRVLVPYRDTYQQLTDAVALNQQFNIDGFTKITINTIQGGNPMVVQYGFFPAQNVNLGANLVGAPVAQGYGAPKIINYPGGQTA